MRKPSWQKTRQILRDNGEEKTFAGELSGRTYYLSPPTSPAPTAEIVNRLTEDFAITRKCLWMLIIIGVALSGVVLTLLALNLVL